MSFIRHRRATSPNKFECRNVYSTNRIDVYTAFVEQVKNQSVLFGEEVNKDVAIVYSPLNGTGLKPVTRTLKEMPEIPLIYILYLLNTTASYFFVYKKSILITDQKSYIASLTYICTTTLQNLLQIVFLLTTHNFIIYLLIQIVCTLANNMKSIS